MLDDRNDPFQFLEALQTDTTRRVMCMKSKKMERTRVFQHVSCESNRWIRRPNDDCMHDTCIKFSHWSILYRRILLWWISSSLYPSVFGSHRRDHPCSNNFYWMHIRWDAERIPPGSPSSLLFKHAVLQWECHARQWVQRFRFERVSHFSRSQRVNPW